MLQFGLIILLHIPSDWVAIPLQLKWILKSYGVSMWGNRFPLRYAYWY